MKENTPPKFLDKLQFQELIKEWQENKLKNNEEVRKKREEKNTVIMNFNWLLILSSSF
jgi:hypothetical protein